MACCTSVIDIGTSPVVGKKAYTTAYGHEQDTTIWHHVSVSQKILKTKIPTNGQTPPLMLLVEA